MYVSEEDRKRTWNNLVYESNVKNPCMPYNTDTNKKSAIFAKWEQNCLVTYD